MTDVTATAPEFRLVRGAPAAAVVPVLDAAQQAVVDHPGGPLLVLAGPGTGKTTTLVEAVVARIDAGVDPERILVLTFGRRAAAELRDRVSARESRTLREPLARTFHSYAFGILRREAALEGEPPPRLLAGPEQDLMIRELLLGDLEAGGHAWPDGMRAALPTRGFAQELRDLMMRCAERSVTPEQLEDLGRRHGRPDWRAAARFAGQYGDVSALASPAAYDPAELIGTVVGRLEDPDDPLLVRERAAYDWIFVDEYQDTDPAQERLLRLLVPPGGNLVVVGDPDQSIYAFRGADLRCITRFPQVFPARDGGPASSVTLTTCRRSAPRIVETGQAVVATVRSRPQRAALQPLPGRPPGQVDVLVASSASQEASLVAGVLRRAHLVDGVPWSRMAVLVRSTRDRLAILRRALLSAGVPVGVAPGEVPLADQPGLRPLLDVLGVAVGSTELTPELAGDLLGGALGGVDAVGLRRLRRELRRAEVAAGGGRSVPELLVAALLDERETLDLPDAVRRAPARLAALIATARAAAAAPGASAETVLWATWSASGLSGRWQAASLAGGARGAAADRDLDAAMALFEAAARFVDRLPVAGPALFFEHLAGQQIPGDSLATRAPEGEIVRILTAHAAKGLEWDVVVVAGVQEGVWPDLRVRGSLLGTDMLLDVVSMGGPVPGSPIPRLLDEERRLFYVAVTRARERLVLTAVRDPEDGDEPSRLLAAVPLAEDDTAVVRAFTASGEPAPGDDGTLAELRRALPLSALLVRLRELRADDRQPVATRVRARDLLTQLAALRRSLDLASLVAELRATLLDPQQSPAVRQGAATALARLADAGVAAADPADWYGTAPLSDDRPLHDPGDVVAVSPSRVEQFTTCELRWLLESVGGTTPDSAAQTVGTLVHALAAATTDPRLRERDALVAELDRRWAGVDLGSPWFTGAERKRAVGMIDRFLGWLASSSQELVGTELDFRVDLPVPVPGGELTARLNGRVDRLERDAEGRAVVIDLKTGTSYPKDDELGAHPQLGVYQLAVEQAAFAEQGLTEPGGAALVQVGKGAKTREARVQPQPPLGDAEDPAWARTLVAQVAQGMAGATVVARENTYCEKCPVRSSCPVHPEGQHVGESPADLPAPAAVPPSQAPAAGGDR